MTKNYRLDTHPNNYYKESTKGWETIIGLQNTTKTISRVSIVLLNVLFMGNSHTYYNFMPHMLLMLVDSAGRGIELRVISAPVRGPAWHGTGPIHPAGMPSGKNHGTMLSCRTGVAVLSRSRTRLCGTLNCWTRRFESTVPRQCCF